MVSLEVITESSSAAVQDLFAMPKVSPALPACNDAVLISNFAGFFNVTTLREMMAEFGDVVACVLLPPDGLMPTNRCALIQYADATVMARVIASMAASDFEVGGLVLHVVAAPAALTERHLTAEAPDKK